MNPPPGTHTTFTVVPQGPFSLMAAGTFGFGQRLAPQWDGVLRMAFCLDGYSEQAGVEVRQDAGGVHCLVHGDADIAAVRRQVARVLSLDHDARAFVAIGDRDPVIKTLLDVAPGLRPPLFYSPYEAAVWAVLSARRPAAQMAETRRQLSETHGRTFSLAGQAVAALPTPEQLLAIADFPGVSAEKLARMQGVARAAQSGQLDAATIRVADPDTAMAALRDIKGIGPFYSALIVIRASGHADVLPGAEPKLRALMTEFYGLSAAPTEAELAEVAQPWRPFRTWAAVLIRAAGPRLSRLGG